MFHYFLYIDETLGIRLSAVSQYNAQAWFARPCLFASHDLESLQIGKRGFLVIDPLDCSIEKVRIRPSSPIGVSSPAYPASPAALISVP